MVDTYKSSTQSPLLPIVVADIVFALNPFVNVVVPDTVPPENTPPPPVPVVPVIICPDELIKRLADEVPDVILFNINVLALKTPSTEELPLDINPFFIINSFAIITFPIQ